MPRFFTLTEAEALLPAVEKALRNIIKLKREYDESEGELNRISRRITMAGGMMPPRDQIIALKNGKHAAAEGLKQSVEQIQSTGCQLKDVGIGLVDFPDALSR